MSTGRSFVRQFEENHKTTAKNEQKEKQQPTKLAENSLHRVNHGPHVHALVHVPRQVLNHYVGGFLNSLNVFVLQLSPV